MLIEITDVTRSTWIVIAALLLALVPGQRREPGADPLPVAVTQELKGLAILAIVFAHIAYMLVSDSRFLYPLSIAAGVGVDLFLFMSGYGLTAGMLRKPLAPRAFYQRRLLRVYIPFWIALVMLLVADRLLLGRSYAPGYMIQSLLGWFPRASAWEDVNSPFWYISWMLLFYLLYPLLFSVRRAWLSAIVIAVIANTIAIANPLGLQANWLHRLHTNAFSLGMLLAWLFASRPQAAASLCRFRDQGAMLPRWLAGGTALLVAGFVASHNTAADWPALSAALHEASFDSGFFIGQSTSLAALVAVVALFMLKTRSMRFLYLFGVFSYETYLLHWPLMSRYDAFYHLLPAWLATLAWLGAFLVAGIVLQHLVGIVEGLLDRRTAAAGSVAS